MARTTNTARSNKEEGTTAKKRNRNQKSTLIPKDWKVQRGGNSNKLNGQTRDAQSEKAFQISVDRYQKAILSGNYTIDTIVAKADSELERIQKMEADINRLSNGKEKPVSTWKTLAELYQSKLAPLTKDMYLNESNSDLTRAMKKARGPVTKEQEAVLTTYFIGRANANFSKIDNIRRILVMKGAIVDVSQAKKIDEMLEQKATELATANEQLVASTQQ